MLVPSLSCTVRTIFYCVKKEEGRVASFECDWISGNFGDSAGTAMSY